MISTEYTDPVEAKPQPGVNYWWARDESLDYNSCL